ncbi:MAG TPA: hypothetical protein VGM90_38780 [Kofleriaceae bacterium]|jgi:hypothetical protein
MRAILFALCVLSSTAVGLVGERDAHAQPSPEQRRENIKKKIRALRAYTLTDQLALDEATAGKLFPILAKWDDVVDKLLVARGLLAQQLKEPDGKDPKVISKAIDDSIANQRALWDVEEKRLAELRKILTPAQTAKLLTVLPQFERRLQNQLRRAIEGKGGGGKRGDGRPLRGRSSEDRINSLRNPYGDDDDDNDARSGGELGGNPFDPGDETPAPKTKKKGAQPSQAPGATPAKCDPFSDARGCRPNQ